MSAPKCACEIDYSHDLLGITFCPLHAAAPELLAALEAIETILDGRQPKDVPGAVMVARAAIAIAKAVS